MKTIWKYPLRVQNVQTISVPSDAAPLCVQMQHGVPTLWMLATPSDTPGDLSAEVDMTIDMYGTGHPIPEPLGRYLGTAQVGALVWHYFIGASA